MPLAGCRIGRLDSLQADFRADIWEQDLRPDREAAQGGARQLRQPAGCDRGDAQRQGARLRGKAARRHRAGLAAEDKAGRRRAEGGRARGLAAGRRHEQFTILVRGDAPRPTPSVRRNGGPGQGLGNRDKK